MELLTINKPFQVFLDQIYRGDRTNIENTDQAQTGFDPDKTYDSNDAENDFKTYNDSSSVVSDLIPPIQMNNEIYYSLVKSILKLGVYLQSSRQVIRQFSLDSLEISGSPSYPKIVLSCAAKSSLINIDQTKLITFAYLEESYSNNLSMLYPQHSGEEELCVDTQDQSHSLRQSPEAQFLKNIFSAISLVIYKIDQNTSNLNINIENRIACLLDSSLLQSILDEISNNTFSCENAYKKIFGETCDVEIKHEQPDEQEALDQIQRFNYQTIQMVTQEQIDKFAREELAAAAESNIFISYNSSIDSLEAYEVGDLLSD